MAEEKATIKKNTVNVKDYRKNIVEYPAGAAVSPGQLVKLNGSGQVIPFTGAADASNNGVAVALEDESWGKSIEDDYATGARVRVWYPLPGDEAILKAHNIAFTVGASVDSHTNGLATTGTTDPIGVALEALSAATTNYVHVRFV